MLDALHTDAKCYIMMVAARGNQVCVWHAEGGELEGKATVVPRVPTWFLSAVAPPLKEEEADSLMMGLSWQARTQFVQQGNAPAAWAALEPGILQACHICLKHTLFVEQFRFFFGVRICCCGPKPRSSYTEGRKQDGDRYCLYGINMVHRLLMN